MIYSPTLGFIFIKGLKVGGTSVEIALSAICGPQDIVTPITFRDEHERFRRSGKLCRNYGADEKALRAYQTALERWSQDDEIPKHPEGRFRNHMSLAEVQAAGLQTAELQMLICERSPYEKVVSLSRWRTLAQAYQRSEEVKASHR